MSVYILLSYVWFVILNYIWKRDYIYCVIWVVCCIFVFVFDVFYMDWEGIVRIGYILVCWFELRFKFSRLFFVVVFVCWMVGFL